ncbi:hypothetical protein SAMN05421507_114167 [Lentzea jiangxiensis]|uniref:Uncharacterized protein n=1 Tax=Lentzea jiangxiensis TaxID=641025 RepID=A0A1H0VHZ0_9PSEU|nr:hypothetical protein SAMN05421507_114167 [Lentzea jiangxiensis]
MQGCSQSYREDRLGTENERDPPVLSVDGRVTLRVAADFQSVRLSRQARTSWRSFSSAALGFAPTICFTGRPPWNRISVGTDMIW